MWSDNETDLDLLDVSHLAAAVKHTILNPALSPVTVGVFGDWGSGKSSLVSIVRGQLDQPASDDTLCIAFDGWLFEGYEDAKTALMGTILDELRDRRGAVDKAGELFKGLLGRVNWMRVMGLASKQALTFMVGGPVASIAQGAIAVAKSAAEMGTDEAEKLFKESPGGADEVRKNIREFRKDFAKLLEQTGTKRLVVFIDNLDRCLPDTVIETLEAVRLFLFVPGTAFVISADERLVREAVRQRFPQHATTEFDVARDYLEKLVQVPVRIPALGPSDVRRYMNLLFAQIHFGDGFKDAYARLPTPGGEVLTDADLLAALETPIPEDLKEGLALTAETGDVLAAGLQGNPRQIKRFLNTLLLRISMAKHRSVELKRRVLAKLMVLEYLRTESFRALATWQASQSGKPIEIKQLEDAAKGEKVTPVEEGKPVTAAKAKAATADSPATPAEEQRPEITMWLADPWIKAWLLSGPSLVGEDLRPYFFVSQDRIGPLSSPALRLSPAAQAVATDLTAGSKTHRQLGLSKLAALSPVDANGVFQLLTDQARHAESLDSEDSPLTVLLLCAAARTDLVNEALKFVGTLPVGRLGMGIPPRLKDLGRKVSSASTAVDSLLTLWSTSANAGLADAAKNMLKRAART